MSENYKDIHRYDDIIGLPHHVSETRPRMPIIDRAAQFAPFAALTGYDAVIEECARLTEEKPELDEDSEAALNLRLTLLTDKIESQPEVTVTYFKPDSKKTGGAYVTVSGRATGLDKYEHNLILNDVIEIPVGDILSIESKLFDMLDIGSS